MYLFWGFIDLQGNAVHQSCGKYVNYSRKSWIFPGITWKYPGKG